MSINKLIKEYEIDIVGSSNGIDIPANHRIVIRKAMVMGNGLDNGYDLWLEVCTFKDGNHDILLKNDLTLNNNLTIDLGATKPTSGIATLTKTNFESWMDSNIGSSNYTEIS